MTTILGNDSDNNLIGTSGSNIIRARGGNDSLQGLDGNDTMLGGKNDDHLFGGRGSDVLSGDGETIGFSASGTPFLDRAAEKGDDALIGGSGTDILVGFGDDILVGSGPNTYNSQLLTDLENTPFSTFVPRDGVRDTFIALNKDKVDYTLTVIDFERNIDQIDLRAFGVRRAGNFQEIQDKGDFFEAKTPVVNEAELVLRININPTLLTYV